MTYKKSKKTVKIVKINKVFKNKKSKIHNKNKYKITNIIIIAIMKIWYQV